ncbi:hypothetical protein FE783_28050 [Paenibacillus mesophilus]|uniref:hypothetical protein n=1 Tax=Paenibacillus mesophilus TaxID=2582849 RepID=UPI00110E3937|nr:hypothetical protein [Paenibacillus mesophilus]TMV45790.1 hypothetical protein FE783_28050 [Paenibacillus mesophilus]
MSKKLDKEAAWADAKKRCRLSDEEIRMAKELGMTPKSLTKNIPSPSQKWKAPVREWVWELYAEKFGNKRPSAAANSSPLPVKRSAVKIQQKLSPSMAEIELPF